MSYAQTVAYAWPPEYTVRESNRAKYLQLRISRTTGLEVIVPKRLRRYNIQQFLDEKRTWIEANLAIHTKHKQGIAAESLPSTLELRALSQSWQIMYQDCALRPRIVPRPDQVLTLLGDIEQQNKCQQLLLAWLKRQAHTYFEHELTRLCSIHGFEYQRLSIRAQRARWGSCSQDKEICLNYKLLFLPPALCQHVLLHELCHTRHMDHSRAFWKLLKQSDPEAERNKRALSQADHYLPLWLEKEF